MTEKDLKYQELKRAYDKLLEEKKLLEENKMLKEENRRFRVSNGMLEEELEEYKELDEKGLLLKLPCKVGDKVYHVIHDDQAEPPIYISEPEIQDVSVKAMHPIERGCITGKNPNGTCACCGNEGTVKCCMECQDKKNCNSVCGWFGENKNM